MMMIPTNKYIIQLVGLYLVLLVTGLLVIRAGLLDLPVNRYILLVSVMSLITLGAFLLIMTGIKRAENDRGIFMLVGLGGKFLAYLVMLLLFWALGKNLTKGFIIGFFVLYLLLTLFLIRIVYKVLKTN